MAGTTIFRSIDAQFVCNTVIWLSEYGKMAISYNCLLMGCNNKLCVLHTTECI